MIEILSIGKLVELFKLIINGLSYAKDKIIETEDKEIMRKIIQIQLSLEDIVDNAKKQLKLIKEIPHDYKINDIRELLINQRDKILFLSDLLYDKVFERIFKLYDPKTRRSIERIVMIKEGALYEVIYKIERLIHGKKSLIKDKIFKNIDEQEKIINELEGCSLKISEFINKNFNFKEVLRFI